MSQISAISGFLACIGSIFLSAQKKQEQKQKQEQEQKKLDDIDKERNSVHYRRRILHRVYRKDLQNKKKELGDLKTYWINKRNIFLNEKKEIFKIRKNLGLNHEQESVIEGDNDPYPANNFHYGNCPRDLPMYEMFSIDNISKLDWTKTQLELEKYVLEHERSQLEREKSYLEWEEIDLKQKKSDLEREYCEFYAQEINGIKVEEFFQIKFLMISIHTNDFDKIKGAFIPVFQKRHEVDDLMLNDLESLMNLMYNYYFIDPDIFETFTVAVILQDQKSINEFMKMMN
jgi:hypothetical protein